MRTLISPLSALALALALVACDGGSGDDTADTADTADSDTDVVVVDVDKDGFAAEEDCDDTRSDIYPGAPEDDCTDPTDYNCDGKTLFADVDKDTVAACEDCDDTRADVKPGADEICDDIDNDCDEKIDAADDSVVDARTFAEDKDKDGYGDPATAILACEAPTGFVDDDTDCNDANIAIHPDSDEICDTIDNDCDTLTDDLDDVVVGQPAWYIDTDKDGLGDPDSELFACIQPSGYVSDGRDCDDAVPSSGLATDWFEDKDGDLYGATSRKKTQCDQPAGYVAASGDCDDRDAKINPLGIEVCDSKDNDCDTKVDDDDTSVTGRTDWYPDDDEDEYGDKSATAETLCEAPTGYVDDKTDCDDTDRLVHPGRFDWDNDKNDDCDSSIDEDVGKETYKHDTDIQSLWNTSCTGCHGSSGGLSLSSSAHGKIVNVKSSVTGYDYIEPGDLDRSYLWRKLNNTHTAIGGRGSAMPTSGSLSSSTLEKIEQWIEEGAVK
jgi:hypothetical protein